MSAETFPYYRITTCPRKEEYRGNTLEALVHHVDGIKELAYFQVWIQHENGEALGVFFNTAFSSVGWMTEEGESAIAYNPNYSGPPCAMQPFYIENGQLDEYPEADCVSTEEGVRALLDFLGSGRKPAWLHWRE